MNVFAKFDEILSMILQDITETKRYGHTVGRSDRLSDNVKTVYPPTNTVCGGIKMSLVLRKQAFCICENKDADQLHGNHEADQRLCFCYLDSTIRLLRKSEISSL